MCLDLRERAALPEPEAAPAAVADQVVELPPVRPLGTALADLLGGIA